MDKATIAVLEDYKVSVNRSFKKIKENMNNATVIKSETENVKLNINLMKEELNNLKEEHNINTWQSEIDEIKSKNNLYKSQINKINEEIINNNTDYMDIDKKINYDNFSSKQLMERGDKILKKDGKTLKDIHKKLLKNVEDVRNMNAELYKQNEKMDEINDNLKLTGEHLKRGQKHIKELDKMA